MGRVTREEHRPPPVAIGQAVVEAHPAGPGDVRDPRPEACPIDQLLQLGTRHRRPGTPVRWRRAEVTARGQQPVRRPLPQREREEHASPARGHVRRTGRQTAVELDVGEHDLASVRPAPPSDLRDAANRAVGPVTARDHPTNAFLHTGRRAQQHPDPLPRIAQLDELDPTLDRNSPSGQRIGEDVRLPHQGQVRVRRVRQREAGQPGGDDATAEVQPDLGFGVGSGQQFVDDPERSQDLQRAGVHQQRAGWPERLMAALHHSHPRPVGASLQCDREARRACADDQDVHLTRHRAHRRAETGGTARATIMGGSCDITASIRRGERGGIRRRTSSRCAKVPPWDGRAHVRGREHRRQESKDPVGGAGRLLRGPASREHRCW